MNRGIPKEQADTIVDSVLDWIDSDETHRLHGAESDYYMSLPNPYKAKNNKFDAVEELLLVKGMTPEILYGTGKMPGLSEFLTINGKAGGINVNAAPKEVLVALPGMTPETADMIIGLRTGIEIKDLDAVSQAVGDAAFKLMSPYVGFTESTTFTIEATGYKNGTTQGLTIRATVDVQAEGKYRIIYYKSPAGMKQWEESSVKQLGGI